MKRIKILTVLLLIFTVLNSLAQSKWSIGLCSYPKIDNRIILPEKNSKEYVDYRNDNETYNLGLDYGFDIQYMIADNWGIGSGLFFSFKSYKTEEDRLIDPCFSPITCGYNTEFYTYKFKYLQVPIHVIWNKKTDKLLSFQFSGGLSINYRLENKVIYTLNGTTEENNENEITRDFDGNINSFDIAVDLGLGLTIGLTKNIDLRIIPSLNFSVIPYQNEDIKNHLYNINLFRDVNKDTKELMYSMGLSVSLRYNLFKEKN